MADLFSPVYQFGVHRQYSPGLFPGHVLVYRRVQKCGNGCRVGVCGNLRPHGYQPRQLVHLPRAAGTGSLVLDGISRDGLELSQIHYLYCRHRRYCPGRGDGHRPVLPHLVCGTGGISSPDRRQLCHSGHLAVHGGAQLQSHRDRRLRGRVPVPAGCWPLFPWPPYAKRPGTPMYPMAFRDSVSP